METQVMLFETALVCHIIRQFHIQNLNSLSLTFSQNKAPGRSNEK